MKRFQRFRVVDQDGTITRLVSLDRDWQELTVTYAWLDSDEFSCARFSERHWAWAMLSWLANGNTLVPGWE
jgi:hypothetical protein